MVNVKILSIHLKLFVNANIVEYKIFTANYKLDIYFIAALLLFVIRNGRLANLLHI